MKQLLLVLGITAAVACGQNKQSGNGYGSGRDTTRTVVLYTFSAPNVEYKTSHAVRFSWDTTLPDPKDKTRNVPARDTMYNILIINKMYDSTGAALKTVAGKDSFYVKWEALNKGIVVKDYNYDYMNMLQLQGQPVK